MKNLITRLYDLFPSVQDKVMAAVFIMATVINFGTLALVSTHIYFTRVTVLEIRDHLRIFRGLKQQGLRVVSIDDLDLLQAKVDSMRVEIRRLK